MKNNIKKYGIVTFFLSIVLLIGSLTTSSGVMASSPQQLYEQVWKLVNSKYVDHTNNQQDWSRWRKKYDKVIVVTDSKLVSHKGLGSLLLALEKVGNVDISVYQWSV